MIKLNELSPVAIQQKYGDVLFGSNPKLATLQNKKPERNTSTEEKLYVGLRKWFKMATDENASFIQSQLNDILALEDDFPQILQPPYGKNAYRGTSLEFKDLKKWIEDNTRNRKLIEIGNDHCFTFTKPYPYTPKRQVTSWTLDPDIAKRFEGGNFQANKIPVIFQTKIDDSFILNPEAADVMFASSVGQIDPSLEQETFKFNPKGVYYLIITQDNYNDMYS